MIVREAMPDTFAFLTARLPEQRHFRRPEPSGRLRAGSAYVQTTVDTAGVSAPTHAALDYDRYAVADERGCNLFVLGLVYLLYALLFANLDGQSFTAQDQARIRDNLGLAGNALLLGAGFIVIGLAWNYLEEPLVGVILLLAAALFYWGLPLLIGQVSTLPNPNTLGDFALTRIRNAAWVLFPPGLVLTVFVSLSHAIKRLRYGAGMDQTLKLGAEVSKQQVPQRFLGKCWQLPYCRDYVRERCPIYHARRTCWREGVGCMCEEKNIALALKDVRVSDDPKRTPNTSRTTRPSASGTEATLQRVRNLQRASAAKVPAVRR
jgi:hypothetical protein